MSYDTVMASIDRVRERNRQKYDFLSNLTGMSIAELDADLTAPDPSFEFTGICSECPVSDTCQEARSGATTCPQAQALQAERVQACGTVGGWL